jgi:hypothetical protein
VKREVIDRWSKVRKFEATPLAVCSVCTCVMDSRSTCCSFCAMRITVPDVCYECNGCKPMCESCKGSYPAADMLVQASAVVKLKGEFSRVKCERVAGHDQPTPPLCAAKLPFPVVVRDQAVIHWATASGKTGCNHLVCGTPEHPAANVVHHQRFPTDWSKLQFCKSCKRLK